VLIRLCVLIPTYNNPKTVAHVVSECLTTTPFPVLVIDDGSSVPVKSLVGPHERLVILRLPVNQGKGVALQKGIEVCVERGFTHMLSIDGDGQHLPSEIPKLVELCRNHPWDLIIGNRCLKSETVPGASKFGRKFSNFWVGYQTSRSVADSQSGFRVYPLFHVQGMRFFTRRFDFEIEVMIRLLWKGVEVREVEVDCHYPERSERVSHFHKFWDNARISLLNTILVAVSLLKSHQSAREIGLAVGIGVLVGCTPLMGFHTLIVAALAFAFRLNAAYMWLGTQISIPPLAPFLAIASIQIGSLMFAGGISEGVLAFSWHWFVGSLVVGSVLGIALGAAAIFSARTLTRGRLKKAWTGETRGGVIGNWILINITRKLGLGIAYFCLNFVIPYFYLFAPTARRASNEYWRIIRPEAGFLRRQLLVLRHLNTFARILMDRVYQGASSAPRFEIRRNGIENILEPVRSGRGLILLGAHVGAWDLSAALLQQDGLGGDFHLIRYQSSGITFEKVRGAANPGHLKDLVINQEQQPVLSIRRILGEGKPVGLMGDRPLANHFELVKFLGRLAPIDCTPFRIAAACEANLLFTFGFKGEGKCYEFHATKSRRYQYSPDEDRTIQCGQWAQEYANVLEGFLRKYPDQWSNFFPFWSSEPKPLMGKEASTPRNHLLEEARKPTLREVARGFAPTPSAEAGSPL
jgi:predicted LPLAT superfamily acyltransferase/uncharacterized protein (DUF2062 family)